MRVQFKQAANLGGKDYPRGIHEVPEDHINTGHFNRLSKAGLLVDAEDMKIVPHETLRERQEKLAKRLDSLTKKKSVSPEKVSPPTVDKVEASGSLVIAPDASSSDGVDAPDPVEPKKVEALKQKSKNKG